MIRSAIATLTLLLLASCASLAPRDIKDVNVGDTLTYNYYGAPQLKGCQLKVTNIITEILVDRKGEAVPVLLNDGSICGHFSCAVPSEGVTKDDYVCFSGDTFKRSTPEDDETYRHG